MRRRSSQRTSGFVAEGFQRKIAFHALAGWRELPSGEQLDAGIFADLLLTPTVAFEATLDIRRVLERGSKQLFLLGAVLIFTLPETKNRQLV